MYNQKKTKIIATLGPASNSEESIKTLIESGVNVFRFNMKQANLDWHNENINKVQSVANKINIPVGIMIDLQGPEIRIETPDKKDISVEINDEIIFASSFISKNCICVPNEEFFKAIREGDIFSIEDGFLEFKVEKKENNKIIAKSLNDGLVKHRKGLNTPGRKLDLPSLIEDDIERLDLAAKNKIDFIALSFSRTKKDIDLLREEMAKRNISAKIIAKIENQESIQNLDELIESADAIMIARGDLGIEVPIERIAYYQRNIIKKCRMMKKPVIVATQMLESMMNNPKPTRAEATDVANAVFNGTDAVMLSGETAMGKYPIKTVTEMAKIVKFNERKIILCDYEEVPKNLTEMIVRAAMSMTTGKKTPKIDAFVVFTESGYTAKLLSSLRPKIPIITITDNQKYIEELTLYYGITSSHKIDSNYKKEKLKIIETLKKKEIIKTDQNIVVIYGKHKKMPEITNSIMLMKVR